MDIYFLSLNWDKEETLTTLKRDCNISQILSVVLKISTFWVDIWT